MKIHLLIMSGLLTASFASAQTLYYVDGGHGNDLNNGTTELSAWKTIQKACNAATPNSIVQIKVGTYYENIVVNVSGTTGNPVIFKNYQQDEVIIDGNGTSGSALLTIQDKSHLRFEGLVLQHLNKKEAKGILVESTANAANPVTDLYFKNISVSDINWTNNKATLPGANDNAQAFIAYGRGTSAAKAITNLVIDSCKFYNNIPGYSEVLSLDGNINGFTIKNNQVYDNMNIGIYVGGNYKECSVPALDHTRNGVIENNTCYNNVALYATSGGIYADGAQHVLIQKNRSYRNGYGIDLGCEENGSTDSITVINNLVYNNTDAGITVGGYTTQTTGQVNACIIRNNTLFRNDSAQNGSGEFYITKASNCIFENNIVYTNKQQVLLSVEKITPQTGNKFNYNCWYTPSNDSTDITVEWAGQSYSSFAAYRKGTSQDFSSLFKNPLISADFILSAASPCINAGNASTTLINGETDFMGRPRVSGVIDIGAYETTSIITGVNDVVKNKSGVFAYPNPFQTSTVIYSNTYLNNAVLEVYDLTGKRIREIKNVVGKQVTVQLSTGLYFYRLVQRNNIIATGKLISVD